MRVVIVGGVAGDAGTAKRLRRRDESAEITLCERGVHLRDAEPEDVARRDHRGKPLLRETAARKRVCAHLLAKVYEDDFFI